MRWLSRSASQRCAEWALASLAIGSGFYLTQITPLSPIYPALAFSLVLCALSGRAGCKFELERKHWPIAGISLLASAHFLLYLAWAGPFNSALGFYLNFVFLGVAWLLLARAPQPRIEKIGLWLIDFTIALGAAECIVRWFFPFQEYSSKFLDFVDESGSVFYLYKFNSIMYQDSNFVGMWLLVVAVLALGHFGWNRARTRIVLLSALLMLTVCRSAILFYSLHVSLLLGRQFIKSVALRRMLSTLVALGLLVTFFLTVANDESFQSKFTILGLVSANYVGSLRPDVFVLGAGLSNSAELLDGIAAHNFLAEVLIDAGLIGLSYTLFTMFYLARLSGRVGYTVVLLFLLAGMSFAPLTTPYLFVILSMLAFMNMKPRHPTAHRAAKA